MTAQAGTLQPLPHKDVGFTSSTPGQTRLGSEQVQRLNGEFTHVSKVLSPLQRFTTQLLGARYIVTTHVALFALHMRLWHFSTVGLFASTVAQSGVDQYVLKETPIAQAGVLANIGPNGAKSSGAYVSFHP